MNLPPLVIPPSTVVVVFNRADEFLGHLPDHRLLREQIELNRVGSLSFRYPLDGINAALLNRDFAYLRVQENGVMLPRRYRLDDDYEESVVVGRGGQVVVTARGMLSEFEGAVVYPAKHKPGQSPHKLEQEHAFKDATPGHIMRELINRAQARGALPGIKVSFDGERDSDGKRWEDTHDVSFAAGTSYLRILEDMAQDGWVDLRMDDDTLDMYNPDGFMAPDPNNPVILYSGQQVVSGPRKRTRRGIATHVLALGEDVNAVEVADEDAARRWGRREASASDGRLTTNSALRNLASRHLGQSSEVREGFTLKIAMDPPLGDDWPMPGRDYGVGEYIRWDQVRRSGDQLEPLRVRSMTFGWYSETTARECEIELNDQFLEAAIRQARAVKAITGGTVTTSNPRPTKPPKDDSIPKAPASVSITPDIYLDGDRYMGSVQVEWPEVTQNTDGSEYTDHRSYLVALSFGGRDWGNEHDVAEYTSYYLDGIQPGDTVQARLRAQDLSGNYSDFTTSPMVAIPQDDTPPELPSAPVLSARRGVLVVAWDGLDHSGAEMAADLEYVQVTVTAATEGAAQPSASGYHFERGGGELYFTGLDYHVDYIVQMQAVDRAGNHSPWTAPKSARVTPLVKDDLDEQFTKAWDDAAEDVTQLGENLGSAREELEAAQGRIDELGEEVEIAATTAAVEKLYVTDEAVVNELVARAIWAAKVAAQRVLAEEVLIGTGSNMIPWHPRVGAEPHTGATGAEVDGHNDPDLGWVLRVQGGAGTDGLFDTAVRLGSGYTARNGVPQAFDVDPEKEYRLRVGIGVGGTLPEGVLHEARATYQFFNSAGAFISATHSPPVAGDAFGDNPRYIEFRGEVPAAAVSMHVFIEKSWWTSGSLFVVNPSLVPAVDYSLIVDGGVLARHIKSGEITTLHLASNAITADKIDSGAIDTIHLAANAVNAGKIAANAITSSKLDADAITAKHTITGATIQTTSSSNQGIKLTSGSSAGLKVWSRGAASGSTFATGTMTYLLDEGTGRVDMRDRLVIGGSTWLGANAPGLALIPYGVQGGTGTVNGIGVWFNREASTATNGAGVWVDNPATSASRPLNLRGYQGGGVNIIGGLTAPDVWTERSGISGEPNAQVIYETIGGGRVRLPGAASTTTTSSANAYIASNGTLATVESARRSKDAIETAPEEWAERLLDLDPRTWFDSGDAQRLALYMERCAAYGPDPDPEELSTIQPLRRIAGLVAEEVEDAGLETYVVYSEDGEVKSIAYDRLWTLLIPLVRALRDRIAQLETRTSELEDRVSQLEAQAAEDRERIARLEQAIAAL